MNDDTRGEGILKLLNRVAQIEAEEPEFRTFEDTGQTVWIMDKEGHVVAFLSSRQFYKLLEG